MSKKKINNPSKLEDLLHSNSSTVNDSFEKDALEGFSELSVDEVFELKNELDSEFYTKVIEKRNNARKLWYWVALAASIIGIIGFIVSFYFPNQTDNEQLAIQKTEPSRDKSLPLSENIKPELQTTQEDKTPTTLPNRSIKTAKTQIAKSEEKKSDTQNQVNYNISETALAMQTKAPVSDARDEGKSEGSASIKSIPSSVLEQETPASSVAEKEELDEVQTISTGKKSKLFRKKAASEAQLPGNSIEYLGGYKQLNKDLKPLLTQVNCNKQFEATLFFDSNLKIENITWNNKMSLNTSDKKLIEDQLKVLSKFMIKNGNTNQSKLSYTLKYKP